MSFILSKLNKRGNIDSDRLTLRKVKPEDLDDIYEYTSNKSVTKYLSWQPHKNKSQTEEFVRSTISEYESLSNRYTLGIFSNQYKRLIGVISVFNISDASKRVEVSYILNPLFQGKGFMLEALNLLIAYFFKEGDVNRVQARCSTDNVSSENVMKKTGMIYEGTLRDFWLIKKQFKNVKIYSILK